MKLHRIWLILAFVLTASRICLGSAFVGLLFDTANYEIDDRNGIILSGGLRTIDHDGTVAQIGYYTQPGNFFAWVPLTGEGSLNSAYAHTTIGDTGFVDDRFFNGRFFLRRWKFFDR